VTDLISGRDWLQPVHHLPGRPFGSGPAERATVVGCLARQAQAIPDAPFLSWAGSDAPPLRYADAHRMVQQRAALLRASGLARGDRVGILAQTSTELALAVLAVLEAGGVAVPLSPQDPAGRTAGHLDRTGTRLLLHDTACAGIAGSCVTSQRTWSFQELAAESGRQGSVAVAPPAPTDAALIFFTSGTTGLPKPIVQSHYAVAQNAWALAEHHRIRPGTRLLCVLPLHHVNGLGFTVLAVLLGGGHTILDQGFDGLRFWSTVRQHDIHIASLVPNLLRLLASRPGPRAAPPGPLRYVVSAAAPLSVSVARQASERLGLQIVQGYGLSEVANFSCLLPTGLAADAYHRWMLSGRRTSVGPVLPGQQVDIHAGVEPAAAGVEGEIVIRGPCVMSGYLHEAAATEEAFRGGWFHTGDLGYWLPDDAGRRYLHVSGRMREIAKRSGVLVSLLELDDVLLSIPGVADAGSTAFDNTWVDEEIGALVVRQPGSRLTEDDVIERCRRVLAFAAVPKRVQFVAELPRTASGKLRRPEIAERFAADRNRLFVDRRPPPDGPAVP
jgi:acyl-CoA synthetase (AMP-forming)/AMP-acid ligase II